MPIRPENKARYPKDWPSISARIRQRADNRCQDCGVKNYRLGGRDPKGDWHDASRLGTCPKPFPDPGVYSWCKGWPEQLRIVRIVLTVAHLDHQPENCADENLKALCQRCHNRYDMAERRRGTQERARAAMAAGDLFTGPRPQG